MSLPTVAPKLPGMQPLAIVCAHDPEVEVLAMEFYEAGEESFVALAIQSQQTSKQIGIHLDAERVRALHDQLGLYLARMTTRGES